MQLVKFSRKPSMNVSISLYAHTLVRAPSTKIAKLALTPNPLMSSTEPVCDLHHRHHTSPPLFTRDSMRELTLGSSHLHSPHAPFFCGSSAASQAANKFCFSSWRRQSGKQVARKVRKCDFDLFSGSHAVNLSLHARCVVCLHDVYGWRKQKLDKPLSRDGLGQIAGRETGCIAANVREYVQKENSNQQNVVLNACRVLIQARTSFLVFTHSFDITCTSVAKSLTHTHTHTMWDIRTPDDTRKFSFSQINCNKCTPMVTTMVEKGVGIHGPGLLSVGCAAQPSQFH